MNQQLIFTDDLLAELTQWLKPGQYSQLLWLADENTASLAAPLIQQLGGRMLVVTAGEKAKSWQEADKIWQEWLSMGVDRHALLINVGGGVVCDLGGFVAACYKRGIAYINLPTSLLAQVDAAFGGKTGINLPPFKNVLGSFYPAKAVFFAVSMLESLPVRELEAGKAEMFKHALLADTQLWEALLQLAPGEIPGEALIRASVAIKAEITARDPFESGERKLLNFGHTIGHALESWSWEQKEPLLHGEAVMWGMLGEIALSADMRLLDSELAGKLIRQLRAKTGPYIQNLSPDAFVGFMYNDKKNKAGSWQFSLLMAPGEAVFDKTVDEQQFIKSWIKWQTSWL
jgi:3-dehydroquinate synthase